MVTKQILEETFKVTFIAGYKAGLPNAWSGLTPSNHIEDNAKAANQQWLEKDGQRLIDSVTFEPDKPK